MQGVVVVVGKGKWMVAPSATCTNLLEEKFDDGPTRLFNMTVALFYRPGSCDLDGANPRQDKSPCRFFANFAILGIACFLYRVGPY